MRMRGRHSSDSGGGGGKCRTLCLGLTVLLLLCASVYYASFLVSRFHHVTNGVHLRQNPDWRRSSSSSQISAASDEILQLDRSRDEEQQQAHRVGSEEHYEALEEGGDDAGDQMSLKTFPICHERYTEVIPCLDRTMLAFMKIKPNYSLMEHYERHCPPPERRLNCLIPPPKNYKAPIRWPASRDQVWRANVPHTFLALEKSDQHWMVIKGNKAVFPGGGTHFHDGADKYIASLGKMLKNPDGDLSSKGNIRNILDVGCGVASFGAFLLPLNILAMSIAPNDVHENQIQFALERGIPSTLGVLGTMRLPFPSKSFELTHCSRCRIDWAQRGGILLLEVDRLLRAGGYFAWSSPAAYRNDDDDVKEWEAMSSLTKRMCWTIVSKEGQTVIWQKPATNDCYKMREKHALPPLCSPKDDPDAAWQVKMKACIIPLSKQDDDAGGSGLLPWPARLDTPPPRLRELHISDGAFRTDTAAWKERVALYWDHLQEQKNFNVRNVMDMKAHLGGFAAALAEKPVWVMNVVPISEPSTLRIVADRGFIGSMHNWCESFSTYPRTYDLIHVWNLLSDIDAQGCSLEDFLLEVDRLLRPTGNVIFRDEPFMVNLVKKYLGSLHWDAWTAEIAMEKDTITDKAETVLIARKKLYQPDAAL